MSLLEEKNTQLLNEMNSVVSNLIKKFETDEKSIAVNSPHVDQIILDLLIKGPDYLKNNASKKSEIESGLNMLKPPKPDPFPKKKRDLEIDGKDFCMSGGGGNDVTSFKVYATKDVASMNDGSLTEGLGGGEFGMDAEGAGDRGNEGERGISLKGFGYAGHGGRKSGDTVVEHVEDEMDGPGGLITGGDEGDESMKRLLLKQSEKSNNEVYSGGVHEGSNPVPFKADVFGLTNGQGEVGTGGEKAHANGNGVSGLLLGLMNQSKPETLNHQVSNIAGFVRYFVSIVMLSSRAIVKYCNMGMGGNCKMRKIGKPVSCRYWNLKIYSMVLLAILGLQTSPQVLGHSGANQEESQFASSHQGILQDDLAPMLEIKGGIKKEDGHSAIVNRDKGGFTSTEPSIHDGGNVAAAKVFTETKKRASLRGFDDIDADKDRAGFALKSMVGRTDSFVEMSNDFKEDKELDLLSSFAGKSLILDDIPYDQSIQNHIIVPKDEENSVTQQACKKSFPNDQDHFGNPVTLRAAVKAYVSQNCTIDSNCAIGQEWGHPINTWCVDQVTSFKELFFELKTFNDDINGWTTSQVTYMVQMFYYARAFNKPLNSWDVSSVTHMAGVFYDASAFNQTLSNWDVSSVTNIGGMFYDAESFNQPLDNWDVSSVTSMGGMFSEASAFNQPLSNWGVSLVTNMWGMFRYASAFNQTLNNWDVSSVTRMNNMFTYASAFNQPLNNWDVSSVTIMEGMFNGASAFNQPLNNWNVSSVTYMDNMFHEASVFNQDLCQWRAYYDSGADYLTIFDGTSCPNQGDPTYSNGPWCQKCPQKCFPNDLDSNQSPQSLRAAVKAYVDQDCANMPNCAIGQEWGHPINTWCVEKVTSFKELFFDMKTFNDVINGWTTSQVTNMQQMFYYARAFNQHLNDWDVSSVTKMYKMFNEASAFNQPLNNWDVSSVSTMMKMFNSAPSFNQPLDNWDISSVVTFNDMFYNAKAFNQDLCKWGGVYYDSSGGINYVYIFAYSGCPNDDSPTSADGPWCQVC